MRRPTPPGPGVPLRILAFPAGEGAQENPYIHQLYDHMSRRGAVVSAGRRRALLARHDIVHVHWPELLVRWTGSPRAVAWDSAKVLVGLWIARRRGAQLVWTGHNLAPHDLQDQKLARAYFGCFGRMVDLLIALSDGGRDALRGRYPFLGGARTAVIRLGHYRDVYDPPPSRSAARAMLNVSGDEPVLLVMGQIRSYKHIPEFIGEFRKSSTKWQLLVAGSTQGNEALAEEIRAAAKDDDRVVLRLGFVPDEQVPQMHGAADVVVLPYQSESILNSGAAILALSMSRAVVMPQTASTDELKESVGDSWVTTFAGGSASALVAAGQVLQNCPEGSPDLADLEWDALAAQTIAAMTVASQRRRRRSSPRSSRDEPAERLT